MRALSRRQFLFAGAAASLARAWQPPAKRWNILFILADDMGWRDLSCYGSTYYESPNLDRLAREGMRFTNAYAAAPVCSPTRASIMTGRYPARLGMTHITGYRPNPNARWIGPTTLPALPLEEVTIAEALKTEPYATGLIGKWHLGEKPFYPENQGFDVNIGGTGMAMPPDFFYPAWAQPGGYYHVRQGVPIEGRNGEYLTDRLTDEAVRYLQARRDVPFFLYLAHYAVHVPVQAKGDVIEKFRRKADPGNPQHNPVYAAMVQSLDEGVGRVLGALRDLGIEDRTVVIMTSDNGGLNVDHGPNTPPTSNWPLRGGKMNLYEGGIRVPLIVRWPGVVRPGSLCDVPVITTDFYPTIAEIAGVRRDPGHPVDGLSLTPLLRGAATLNRPALYWHYPHPGYWDIHPPGASAVRAGNYKLFQPLDDEPAELYDLSQDLGETTNLADRLPEKAAELERMLEAWRRSVGAKVLTRHP